MTASEVIEFIEQLPGMADRVSASPALFERLATDALASLHAPTWGDKLLQGAAYLTCHRYALLSRQMGGGGEVTSERLGDYSISFAASSASDYGQTVYGRLFEQIEKTLLLTPLVV